MQRYRELHGQGEVIYANPSSSNRRQSSHGSVQSNPFTDSQSIQTASDSSQSTNVIPIALVPHGSVTSPQRSQSPISDRPSQMQPSLLSASSTGSNGTTPSVPTRPAVSPDLGIRFDPLSSSLNLEHVNVSKESFRPPKAPYAHSQASGISNRSSVMTSGSYASDIMYEAPQIVTPASGAVRQVLGVAKAAVVLAPGSNPATPTTANTLRTDTSSRLPARSPLAQSSFGPSDVLAESDAEGQELEIHSHNPFGDEHSPMHRHNTDSMSSFGMPTPVPLPSTASPTRGTYTHPHSPPPIPSETEKDRPVSTFTQAASIIDAEIQGATLVRLASASSTSTANSMRSNNRMTSARFVSPSSAPLRVEEDRFLQDQQARALAAAQSNGRMNGGFTRRMSDATSVASAGGDSLLESFTFVPPSPISSRPPRSPLAQQQQTSGLAARQIQGMSNASALSTGSALEGYTFHIGGPVRDSELPPAPSVPRNTDSLQIGQTDSMQLSRPSAPVDTNGNKKAKPRQRASLDTLALTADLSAFPLNFDEGR